MPARLSVMTGFRLLSRSVAPALCAAVLVTAATAATAADKKWVEKPQNKRTPVDAGERPPRWKEDSIETPAAPEESDLRQMTSVDLYKGYSYYLDRTSISVPGDGTLRYTIVAESDTNARTVLYEAIRCETREYKTYAYLSSSGQFQLRLGADWKRVSHRGPYSYRAVLIDEVLCTNNLHPREPEAVVAWLEESDRVAGGGRAKYKRDPSRQDNVPEVGS